MFATGSGVFATGGGVFATGGGVFATEIGHKMGEQLLPATHHKGDEIGAATIVVVTCITWTIG